MVSPAEPAEPVKEVKLVVLPPADETNANAAGAEPIDKQDEISTTKDAKPTDETEESEESKKVMVGLVSDRKDLYQKFDQNGCSVWSDKRPDDLEEAAENEETLKYAVLVRNRKS